MRDLKNKISQEAILLPQSVSGTFTTDIVGTSAYNAVNLAVQFSDGSGSASVLESTDGSTFTVVENDLLVVGATLSDGAFAITSGVVNDVSYVGAGSHVILSGSLTSTANTACHAIKSNLSRG